MVGISGRNHSLGWCWYCKYGISYRELQEMLRPNGVLMLITRLFTVRVQRYAPEIEKRLRWYWRNPTD